MKNISLALLAFMIILGTACTKKIAKDKTTVVTAPPVQIDVTEKPNVGRGPQGVYPKIKISRSACYGQCPSYNATINSDGSVKFVGFAWVDNIGSFRGVMSKETLDQLMAKAQEINYLEMSNEYPTDGRNIPDLPTVTTEIIFGDMVKQIKDHFDSPASLQEFEVMLDEAIRAIKYSPTEAEKK